MNNYQEIDRLVKHLEYGWSEPTVEAIDMGIHALKATQWIPISERLPEDESYILVSFENATMPDIARYEENDEGGTFYPGDDEKSYSSYGIFVNAWTPLPEPYREEQQMHVEVSEGFRKTIADIVDCCVEGNTNSCTLEVEVRENVSLVIDMKFEVKEKKVDELQS